jgi:hypothetical protein
MRKVMTKTTNDDQDWVQAVLEPIIVLSVMAAVGWLLRMV